MEKNKENVGVHKNPEFIVRIPDIGVNLGRDFQRYEPLNFLNSQDELEENQRQDWQNDFSVEKEDLGEVINSFN